MCRVLIAAMVTLASCALSVAFAATAKPFGDGEIVVFLGDSITQQGQWIRPLTDFYRTRYPQRQISFHNVGIAGGTMSSNASRVSRDVAPLKPTCVVVMCGMNEACSARPFCVGWPVTADDRVRREKAIAGYRRSVERMAEAVRTACGAKTRLLFLTPSIYDSVARTPVGKPENDGWNRLLGDFAALLKEGAEAGGWEVADVHAPMTRYNEQFQIGDREFSVVSGTERVHPDEKGGYFMAECVLAAQGVSPVVSDIVFDGAHGIVRSAENALVSCVERLPDGWRLMVCEKSLPYPIRKATEEVAARTGFFAVTERGKGCNRQWFSAEGLSGGMWCLSIDGERVALASAEQFASGVNLAACADSPQMRQASAVTAANGEGRMKEANLRRLVSCYWWLRGCKLKDPDDIAEVSAWKKANPEKGGWFGQQVASYIEQWPLRERIREEIRLCEEKAYRLAKPQRREWILRRVTCAPAVAGSDAR